MKDWPPLSDPNERWICTRLALLILIVVTALRILTAWLE